ncbi:MULTISPECIES: hemolysin family protein [Sphingosinicellaceae]|uniref:hemolysin family protein n=1 Tax=Sphingosinicellaceae TaxID=2820280 RepID=UPI001C1E7905|nr:MULTISPECIES: hemolysin family protein [Polymorphobacter]QYE35565.1 hemolysin family protein [Polymorphobacter sp. PAMC 29334]UAJ11124.1 hemolysin family protein [Polymorphobacter megasporae]
MADPHPSTDFATRLWRGLRTMIGGSGAEPTLRESLEEAIDEHVGEPADRDDLSAVERTMLKNLLHFGERLVDDAAVPRADIVAFDVDDRFADLVELFREAGHSRLPVFEGSLDNVVGMIHIKDVYTRIATTFDDAVSSKPFTDFDVRTLLRTVLFVPSSMRVLDLLARMRSGRTHMAIVVDEFGGTDGLVTIEDLVEEIVGDIEDEHDEDGAKLLQAIGDDMYEADARLELSELEETTGHVFAAEEIGGEVDTLGGMVFMLAGRVPAVGEMIDHPSGWRFEVIDGDPRMVRRLRLYPPVPAA